MKVLIACEESQTVTVAFRALGHAAFSCDIEPCSGGHPEWHIQQNVIPLLSEDWDMIIAFPPCTHLACSGAKWFPEKIKDGRQQQGIDFFMHFANCHCPRMAIENPLGIMSSHWRKPDQIIQPWQFGDPFQKRTCLWLKGLPLLRGVKPLEKTHQFKTGLLKGQSIQEIDVGEIIILKSGKRMPKWYAIDALCNPPKERARIRSKTFPNIAKAMAAQWS